MNADLLFSTRSRVQPDPGAILLIVILNLLFTLSIVYNATHQEVPSEDAAIAAGL